MFPGSSLHTAPARLGEVLARPKPEADLPGLAYVERAGYRPASAVDLFEKTGPLEKNRHGTLSEVLFR